MSGQTLGVGTELLLTAHRRFGPRVPHPIIDDCWQQAHYELAAPNLIPTGGHYQDRVWDGTEEMILPMEGAIERWTGDSNE